MKSHDISSVEQLDALITELENDSWYTMDYSFLKQPGLHVYKWLEVEDESCMSGPFFIVGKTITPDELLPSTGIFANLKKYGSSKDYKGVMNDKGDFIVQSIYNDIFPISDQLLQLERNGKYGVARFDKGVVCPAEYDKIGDVCEYVFSVSNDGKLGFMDSFGNIVIPMEYVFEEHFLCRFQNGKAYVLKYIDGSGLCGYYIDHYNNIISRIDTCLYDGKHQLDDDETISYSEHYDDDIMDAYEGDESNCWNTD